MTFTQRVAAAQRSVAAIIRGKEMGLGTPIGSGFFVNAEGFLVTNAKVVWEADRLRKQSIAVGLCLPNYYRDTERIVGMDTADCEVVAIDDDYDVAILRATDLKRATGYFELSVTAVPPGTQLAYTGFPLSQEYPTTILCRAATQLTHEPLAKFFRAGPKLLGTFFLVDGTIHDGSRGAGVYLADVGVVVGIASGSFHAAVGLERGSPNTPISGALGYVRPLKRLVEMLQGNGIAYAEFPPLDDSVDR